MVRSNKWVLGTGPDQPLTEVARVALKGRLKTVRHYLPLAAEKCPSDIEYVHQLRVSTRRARAALQIFQDLLPKRQAKWMKRRLRKLRQAAGTARDLDVLGERLQKIARKKGSHLEAVVGQVGDQRRNAQKSLATAYREAKRKRFEKRSRELVEAVRPRKGRHDLTLGEAAQRGLPPLLEEFFTVAEADLADIKAMHRLRIAGKRVRYAMELLGGAFEESCRGEVYASIEELQERLGKINDHAAAIATFTGLLNRPGCAEAGAELVELIAMEQEMLAAKRQVFGVWWTPQRIENLSRQFAAALAELQTA